MSNEESAEVIPERDDSTYDRHNLAELGVNPEILKFLNDGQAKELLKAMLYFIAKKQDGHA